MLSEFGKDYCRSVAIKQMILLVGCSRSTNFTSKMCSNSMLGSVIKVSSSELMEGAKRDVFSAMPHSCTFVMRPRLTRSRILSSA